MTVPTNTPGTGMVERIAKRIYFHRNGAGAKPWPHLTRSHKDEYIWDAIEALEALREPSEAMIDASCDANFGPLDGGAWRDQTDYVPIWLENTRRGFVAAIDAALSEHKGK